VFIPLGLFLGSVAQMIVGSNWRLLIALGALPIFLLLWLRNVPESPRFLQSRGRNAEARNALAWALELPVEQLGALPEIKCVQSASYAIVFSKYLRSLVIITIGSFCFILGSAVIQGWGQSILGSGYKFSPGMIGALFMLVALGDLLGRLASAWLADLIGRRWTMFGFGLVGALGLLIAAASAMITTAASWDVSTAGWVFFVGILIAMSFGDGAFGILNAFGAEQFPNEARSTGLGLGYGIGATAKVFGPALHRVRGAARPRRHCVPVRQGNQRDVARLDLRRANHQSAEERPDHEQDRRDHPREVDSRSFPGVGHLAQ
jgi:putative MFS transporter